jgi:hypothetical protein
MSGHLRLRAQHVQLLRDGDARHGRHVHHGDAVLIGLALVEKSA